MSQSIAINHNVILAIILGLFACSIAGVVLDFLPLVFLPVVLIFGFLLLYNLEWPFLLLFFMVPLSWEQEFSNGFGTDLPTEPLMVLLMGVAIIFYLKNLKRIHSKVLMHGVTLLLLTHYAWTWVATIFSQNTFVSVKFCLAKTWYIATFFFLGVILLRHPGFLRKLSKVVLAPLVVVTCIILYRHSQQGFSFEAANFVMAPFFRNHVNSAALMSVFFPFVLYLLLTTKNFLNRVYYILSIIILLAGIYFSYTRAAHISVILSFAIIPILHFRLVKLSIGVSIIATMIAVTALVNDNEYLEYAPEFEKTISHSTFDDLVAATYEGRDISTMERVYRWVAAFHMYEDRPLMGYGPGNFYNFYKAHTVTMFRTYVSDNPERSGVHCYYLMVLVEQGLIGLIIFFLLISYALLKLENLFHRANSFRELLLISTLAMSFTIIILFQLINDLIETDKIGPFFFLILAGIVVLDLRQRGVRIISDKSLAR